ncbi:MAG TPA: DEAD/DEAH box helicase [Planctomycetota bacterium]
MATFAELGLSEPLCRALEQLGIQEPTPFHERVIPPQLEKQDLLGLAPVGAERTLAFALPLLQQLSVPAVTALPKEPRALVLASDPESADNIGMALGDLGRFLPVRHIVATDGSGWNQQDRLLRTGAEIMVANPRRLLALRRERAVLLRGVETVVIDGVEQLLDMGLDQELDKLLAALPPVYHTVVFAASAAPVLRTFASEWLRDPVSVAAPREKRKTRLVEPPARPRDAGQAASSETLELPAWLDDDRPKAPAQPKSKEGRKTRTVPVAGETTPLDLPAWLDEDADAKGPARPKPKKPGKTRKGPVAEEPVPAEPASDDLPPAKPVPDDLPAWLDDEPAAEPPAPPKSKKPRTTRNVPVAAESQPAEPMPGKPTSDDLPAWLDDDPAAKTPSPPKSKKPRTTRNVPAASELVPAEALPAEPVPAEPVSAEPQSAQPSSARPPAKAKTKNTARRGKKAGGAKKRKRP